MSVSFHILEFKSPVATAPGSDKKSLPMRVTDKSPGHTARGSDSSRYISCRFASARSIVTSSTYSRSDPTGMPMAMRVTRTPSGFSSRAM